MAVPSVKVRNGVVMPQLGLGTAPDTGTQPADAVVHALQHGYRLIDTATMYNNEQRIAGAIVKSGVPRGELFLTSKLLPNDHGPRAYDACIASMKR